MSRKFIPFALVASALIAASFPASADNGFTPGTGEASGVYHSMPGGKTRAEVIAELMRARADGSLAKISSEAGYAPEFETSSAGRGRTRAEVQEELRRAREDGTLAKMNREASYAPEFEARGGRTRAEVLEEFRRARDDGSLRRMNTNRGY